MSKFAVKVIIAFVFVFILFKALAIRWGFFIFTL